MVAWSLVAAMQAFLSGRSSFYACRALLGLIEGGFIVSKRYLLLTEMLTISSRTISSILVTFTLVLSSPSASASSGSRIKVPTSWLRS